MTEGINLTNYNSMKYFGYEGLKEAVAHSFQWKLVNAIKEQLLLALLLLIGIQHIGLESTTTILETWVFKPMSSLWILCGTITADWLAGALKGYKSKEGFVTKKATQIGGKIFFNVLFFAILFNVSEHMIKPIVPNSVDLNTVLISTILILAFTHIISLGKNLAMVGLMPKPFIKWFSSYVDKYKTDMQKTLEQ